MLTIALLLAASLELRVKALQETVMVGEPTLLQITWTAPSPVKIREPEHVRIVISGPDGYSSVLSFLSRIDVSRLANTIGPGTPMVTQYLLLGGDRLSSPNPGPNSLALPRPGMYGIRVAYDELGAVSPPAPIRVSPPEGVDADVYRQLYSNSGRYDPERAEALLAKYPDSPYLRMALLSRYATRIARVGGGQDPDTGELLQFSDNDKGRWQDDFNIAALSDLERGDWGAWDEARTRMLIDLASGSGQQEQARRLEDALLQRHPDSKLAARIRRYRAGAGPDED